MTYIWTNSHTIDEKKENLYPQYTKGSNDNVELLKKTKENFINELKLLATEAESYVISLCDNKHLEKLGI